MDYAKSLTFVFDDPRWKEKIAIGTGLVLVSWLLSFILIGVLGFFILAGYSIRLLQNVRAGEELPLPEWDAWGDDLVRGLKLAVVGIVWALPMIIFVIPTFIGGLMADGSGATESFGILIALCGNCLLLVYGIFIALAAPGYSIAFATDEHINSGLQFTEIWHWTRANVGQVVVAVVVVMVASLVIQLVAGIVGTLLCLIGLVVTIPLGILAVSLYTYHLYGQLADQFPYGGAAGAAEYAPVAPTDLATTPDTAVLETPAAPAELAEALTEEPAPTSDAAAEDAPTDDQTGEEDKPA